MKLYISNSFSLSMLDRETQKMEVGNPISTVRVARPVEDPVQFIKSFKAGTIEIVSAIGHENTAALFSAVIGMDLSENRISVRLEEESRILVGQYIGPRLPEGATSLPAAARIEWWIV